jgi:hypothetical protein
MLAMVAESVLCLLVLTRAEDEVRVDVTRTEALAKTSMATRTSTMEKARRDFTNSHVFDGI